MHSKPSTFVNFIEHAQLREIGVPMLVAALVLFAAALGMLGSNVSALRQSYKAVRLSNEVLLELSEINTLIIGNDSSVRGYGLTDDPQFVRYESDTRHRLDAALGRLVPLTAGSPGQRALVSRLRAQVTKQEAIFSGLTRLGPGHARDIAAAIADPEKRKVRYAAQDTLTALHQGEVKLLSQREQEVERQVARSFYTGIAVVVLAFAAGVLGVALTLFNRRHASLTPHHGEQTLEGKQRLA
jgi:CHASE3 domain sensor protein